MVQMATMVADRAEQWVELDRRAHPRYESRLQTSCFAPHSGQALAVTVVDASRSGLGLIASCFVQPGKTLVFDIPPDGPLVGVAFQGEVVRCVRYAGEDWLIGYRLDRPLDTKSLRRILGYLP